MSYEKTDNCQVNSKQQHKSLEKLSKTELIWIIHRMERGITLGRAIIQLEQIRQTEAYNKADEMYRQAAENKRRILRL